MINSVTINQNFYLFKGMKTGSGGGEGGGGQHYWRKKRCWGGENNIIKRKYGTAASSFLLLSPILMVKIEEKWERAPNFWPSFKPHLISSLPSIFGSKRNLFGRCDDNLVQIWWSTTEYRVSFRNFFKVIWSSLTQGFQRFSWSGFQDKSKAVLQTPSVQVLGDPRASPASDGKSIDTNSIVSIPHHNAFHTFDNWKTHEKTS